MAYIVGVFIELSSGYFAPAFFAHHDTAGAVPLLLVLAHQSQTASLSQHLHESQVDLAIYVHMCGHSCAKGTTSVVVYSLHFPSTSRDRCVIAKTVDNDAA